MFILPCDELFTAKDRREIPFAMIIKWAFPDVTRKMPIGVQGGIVRGYERMAEYKNATAVQWSVMWYSETSAGCKMAVMVGGASCWAENRSQDLADLRSRTSREQLVGERGRGGEQKERAPAKECAGWKGKRSGVHTAKERREAGGRQSEGSRIYHLASNKAFNFCLLMRTYRADAMSLRAANEIILEIIRRNDPFSWLRPRDPRSKMPIRSYLLQSPLFVKVVFCDENEYRKRKCNQKCCLD